MRNILTIGVLLLLLLSCKSTVQYDQPNVVLLFESGGEITLQSRITNGKNAVEEAQKLAFETILFRGIPNSQYNLPLIENRNTAFENHQKYFDNFFKEGYYKTFIISSNNLDMYKDVKKNKILVLNTKINYHALRRDLEQNGVIRKFGY